MTARVSVPWTELYLACAAVFGLALATCAAGCGEPTELAPCEARAAAVCAAYEACDLFSFEPCRSALVQTCTGSAFNEADACDEAMSAWSCETLNSTGALPGECALP